ncbi:acetyltransferase [Salmonella enterica subsp. enterica]|nr:acetyltransferase [Salmonella enterica subsp. enterica]
MQDLSGFTVPKGFRGANVLKVQLWWRYRRHYSPGRRKYCIAGEPFCCVCLAPKLERMWLFDRQ